MDTNAFFNTPDDGAAVVEEATVETKKATKRAKSELQTEMIEQFQKTMAADPNIQTVLKSESDSLAVVKTLCSNTLKNFVQDKANPYKLGKDGQEVRNLIPVTGLCGYRLKNVGSKPISYKTMEYVKNGEMYEGTEVEKVAAPGEEFDLARKYFTILASRPEYSFILANGKVITGKDIAKCVTLDEKLERPHFQFAPDENGNAVSVHDDAVKIPIEGTDGALLPEFEGTFGFLHNPVAKAGGAGKRSGRSSVSVQELAANYFQTMLNGGMN